MDSGVLLYCFIFLAAICLVVPLASLFRLGAVLGYLLAGIAIGPFGLGLIEDATSIMHIAEFGVVMMLFVIGLELEPATLWRLRKSIVGLGGLQVVLTSTAILLAALALGYGWQQGLAVGMALSLSSTALVLQMLQEKNLMQTPVGEASFSVLLLQDIAVIPILVLLPLLAAADAQGAGAHASLLGDLPGWLHALCVAGVIALVIVCGRYFSHHLFRMIAKTRLRDVFTATSLALVVGVTLLMQLVGVSPALGAFVAGVVLANSEYRRTLETDIEPFKGLLLGLFFISVGMGMDFAMLAEKPWTLAALVAGLVLLKAGILFALAQLFRLGSAQSTGFALALAQGGEFAFVLFQFAGQLHILNAEQTRMLILAVALSIALTPLLMAFYTAFIRPRFMSVLSPSHFDHIEAHNPVIIAGFGRFGQVVGRFLLGHGIRATVLEKDPDQIELLRKFGFKGYFGDASRLDLLRGAGAEKARLLVVAVDDVDSSLEIVRLVREEFPQLKIFARARNRRHAYELHRAGVHYYKRETFDSSLNMAEEVMISLGRPASEVRNRAQRFRAHDEETLLKSFEFFDNEPEMINFARTRREELERILLEDVEENTQPSS